MIGIIQEWYGANLLGGTRGCIQASQPAAPGSNPTRGKIESKSLYRAWNAHNRCLTVVHLLKMMKNILKTGLHSNAILLNWCFIKVVGEKKARRQE